MTFGVKRMLVDATVAVQHVVRKTRVREMKILGNAILTVSLCWIVALEIYNSSLFKRDPRKVTSAVKRMFVDATVAVLPVVWKTRLCEMKIRGNAILTASLCWEVVWEMFASSPFKRDPRYVTFGVERLLVAVPVAVLHVFWKTRVGETKILGNAILTVFIC